MRLRLLIAVVALPCALWILSPLGASGESLSSKIQHKRDQIAGKRSTEHVLTSSIAGYSHRIAVLQDDIAVLAARQARIQSDLDAKLARLSQIRTELRAERARLARLRARLVEARAALAQRLVELYKSDNPDILTVVLNSNGFADLLERSEFARRVGEQDNRIIVAVRVAKADATKTAAKLAGLEKEARTVAAAIQQRRDAVVQVKDDLAGRRDAYASARQRKQTVLASVRSDRQDLEGDLKALEAQQARITARLMQTSTGGPVRQGSGGLIWPVNGPIVSPFGMRWGRLHAGVDIAVPSGTPVHAAAAGTVAIAGWVSGYGNYVCIQHGGALSTCYGHNTSLNVSVGQHVGQGQVIASSGCTGHCFGPHVHFETRINGAPVDPMGYL
jgi:murein DD-endopeptidase MepM/ murein hydrolase activator NlpD